MTFDQKTIQWLLPFLLATSIARADPVPEGVRTEGIYRSEVQTNEDRTDYISVLRFASDHQVFLTHVVMPADQERICTWFRPELESQHWSKATSYKLQGNRLSFQTISLNATTEFDGLLDSGVLRMQLVVPTKQNLTYPLTFKFAPCP